MKLSVIIPCYNEKKFLPELIALVKNAPLEDKEIIKGLQIEENGFGIEPEITVKAGKKRCRVDEVGISYYGRSYSQDKKITWKDGFRAAFVVLKYGLFR